MANINYTYMSEELKLLLQMKRTYKFILLLVGFVAGSCILQLAIIVGKFDLANVHRYVERLLLFVTTESPASGLM